MRHIIYTVQCKNIIKKNLTLDMPKKTKKIDLNLQTQQILLRQLITNNLIWINTIFPLVFEFSKWYCLHGTLFLNFADTKVIVCFSALQELSKHPENKFTWKDLIKMYMGLKMWHIQKITYTYQTIMATVYVCLWWVCSKQNQKEQRTWP